MNAELKNAIDEAKAAGWVMEAKEIIPGTTGYQLKNPAGEYVRFGGAEESVWQRAYENGELSAQTRKE